MEILPDTFMKLAWPRHQKQAKILQEIKLYNKSLTKTFNWFQKYIKKILLCNQVGLISESPCCINIWTSVNVINYINRLKKKFKSYMMFTSINAEESLTKFNMKLWFFLKKKLSENWKQKIISSYWQKYLRKLRREFLQPPLKKHLWKPITNVINLSER